VKCYVVHCWHYRDFHGVESVWLSERAARERATAQNLSWHEANVRYKAEHPGCAYYDVPHLDWSLEVAEAIIGDY
jgi:hypothetical protein